MRKILALMLCILVILASMPVLPVSATSSLTVNCSSVLRGVTHCATGSLYGLTETKPADITNLVAPLKPAVFTNPARAGSGYQQPVGAAIPSAGRITGTTGKVMIRLADIWPGWPYQFTNMTDWLNKVNSVITDKKNSGYGNFYGYEIWNEPDGTWNTNNGTFNNLWQQTYNTIRANDSGAKIIGPSYSYYNSTNMNSFLSYCKTNNCLPDIVCWHELSGIQNVSNNINNYRAMETSLGISARPISINEYCDANHALEGQPGSSARFMGKFERYKIDSACITWWFVAYPGRLGSLLATDTQKGAGWYAYKWYADMTGNMVSVTPPNDASTSIDGAACVDSSAKYISFIVGGPNDGTVSTTFTNIPSFIGTTASVKIEKVDWTSKDTVCNGTTTVSTSNYTVSNGQIVVTMTGCNNNSGYRIYITPGSGSATPTPTPAATPTPTPVSGGTTYEAESATRNNCNVFTSSTCSNNQYVGQIDYSDSYVQFSVNAASTAAYTMTVHFANGGTASSTHNVSVNGGAASSITYSTTGGWFNAPNNGATVTKSVNLNSGSNTIKFTKGTNYAEIDYISINSGSATPTPTPAATPTPTPGGNLVTNPGIETGNTSGWTVNGSGTIAASTAQKHTGTYSLLHTGRTSTWNGPLQNLTSQVQSGRTYACSGWMRLDNTASSNVIMTIKKVDGSGTTYTNVASGTATNSSWVQLSGNYTLNVSGTLNELSIYFEGPDSGINYYLDDVSVQ